MPNVNCYLPAHLNARRSELPDHVTLSGLLADAMEKFLEQNKPGKGKKAA